MKGKVALITGGASGLGLHYAKEFLRNGLRAVTLADTNSEFSKKALAEIESEFGPNKAIFVQTDVTNLQQFENAFKKTIEKYENVDILINNAGILNDSVWEKEVDINIKGTIHGMLLGLDKYIPKYKTANEGVIVNISSIAGVTPMAPIPIYCGTKFAVMGMTLTWGLQHHYERTNVKVIGLCPGATDTPLMQDISGRNLGEAYETMLKAGAPLIPWQEPGPCAKAIVKIIKEAPSGTMWIAEAGEEPYEYVMPERETFKK